MNLEIILTARSKELYESWSTYCGGFEFVTIHYGDIFDIRADAVISPSNSFGFMDGGIDLLFSNYWGWEVEEKLQKTIKEKHNGELLVGQAEIVETGNERFPFVICSPTMRVPQTLVNSVNPYLAARALFLLIKNGIFESGINKGLPIADKVKSIAMPGLGTGAGEIKPSVCAKQVSRAIRDIICEEFRFPESWIEAQRRHYELIR